MKKPRKLKVGAHKKVLYQKRFGHLSERVGKHKRIVVFTAVRFFAFLSHQSNGFVQDGTS